MNTISHMFHMNTKQLKIIVSFSWALHVLARIIQIFMVDSCVKCFFEKRVKMEKKYPSHKIWIKFQKLMK